MRKLAVLVVATATAMVATTCLVGAAAGQAPAASAPPGVTVAAGLNNPRQLTFDPQGNLYVAEAGTGEFPATNPAVCYAGAEGPSCAGATGSITKIKNPGHTATSARVARGLLSFAAPDGSAATGVDAVSVQGFGNDIWGIMTHGSPAVLTKSLAKQNGQLLKISGGKIKPQFDVGSYALKHPANGQPADSDPYGLLRIGGTSYVADAAANVVYQINGNRIKTVAYSESRPNNPAFDGTPTSVVHVGRYFYVGQLSSLVPGAAKITVYNCYWQPVTVYGGLTSVTSIAVAGNGDIYATELFGTHGGTPGPPGDLVKIPHNGQPRVTTPVMLPGGVAVDRHNNVYVSVNSIAPGGGSVVRLAA